MRIFDLSLDKLTEVVVTDAKIAQPLDTVTQRLEVLRAADWERIAIPQRNLSELLRYTAGQFVNPLSRNDANWGSYAGLGPKYNTYLLDGLPIDAFADALSLDPWVLKEAEIHKGPASVLYANYLSMDFAGNETSLAGITNFILKDTIDARATRIAISAGSYRTGEVRFYHQDRRERLSYFVGGSFEHSDYTAYGAPDSWLHTAESPRYERSKLYADVAYTFDTPDRQTLSLFVHRTNHWGDTGRPNRQFDNHYETVNAVYNQRLDEAWNLQGKAGYRHYDRSWEEDNYPADLDLRERDGVDQRVYPADLTLNFRHAGSSMLTVGGDFQQISYRTYTTLNKVNANSSGLFLQEKIVGDSWILRAGGRLNRTEHTYAIIDGTKPRLADKAWDSQIWSAGVRYRGDPRWAFFSNVGSSFLAPSAKSVCGTIASTDEGVAGHNGQLPNPNLKPETGLGTDAGVEYRSNTGFAFGFRVFVNRVADAIVDNVVSKTPSQSQSFNAGKVQSRGVELTVEQSGRSSFRWFANLTMNHSEVQNPLVRDQDGTAIPFVPTYVANAGFTVSSTWHELSASPRLQVIGDYYDSTSRAGRACFGSYSTLNLRIEGALARRRDRVTSCVLDLNNLLNRRFAMPWQFRDPGFNASFGVEFSY